MNQADQKKVVLVVDDAPANIQIVKSILKDLYKIRVATSGAKALELAKVTPPPDLILMDVMMPEMDGYEVCKHLKLDPETRDIPVIFLTGQTHVDEETKGFEVGAVDYIHKPFSPAVVKARVHTHLMLRGIREQLAQQLLSIQKELETARQIQLSILPSEIPKIEGLDIAARYLPMTAVAGDFYDFIVVDEKRIGILVADVLRPRNARRAYRLDAEDCALRSRGTRGRSGASVVGPESSAVRKVPAPLRHRGLPVRGHAEANPDLRWRGPPTLAFAGWIIQTSARCGGERFVSGTISVRNVLVSGVAAQCR